MWDREVFYADYPCPVCGSQVEEDYTCPGYPGNWNGKPTIMVCSYGCSNAVEYTCTNEECDWWYREPNNRSDKDTMGIRPDWPMLSLYDLSEPDEPEEPKLTVKVRYVYGGKAEPLPYDFDEEETD